MIYGYDNNPLTIAVVSVINGFIAQSTVYFQQLIQWFS